MPTAWPFQEFREYLRALMDAAGIPDYAELSRLSGVSQTQFSHWRRGNAQPSRESLAKVAPVLNAAPVSLWLAAGLARPDELEMTTTPDLRVAPQEFRDLMDLFTDPGTTDEQKAFIRRTVANLVAGVRAESATVARPTRRRRVG